MLVRRVLNLAEVLTEWGASERKIPMPNDPQGIYDTLSYCLGRRAPLIAQVLLAGVLEAHEVVFEPNDLDHVYAMVGPQEQPRTLRQHVLMTPGVAQQMQVLPPLIGTTRSVTGEVTLFDGMHRAEAWARQVIAGAGYDIRGAIFVTRVPAPFEGVGHVGHWPVY